MFWRILVSVFGDDGAFHAMDQKETSFK